MNKRTLPEHWQTKPTDRFILKWIKIQLAARITPHLISLGWLRPSMITLVSAGLGVAGGIVFACGHGWPAGIIAAVGQVLDGVDGQFARLTGRESVRGAYLDSVADRYADGAMMIGSIVYLMRLPLEIPVWLILTVGALALIGSNLVSYSLARAECLGIDIGKPTLASKGTRMSVMIICALVSALWPPLPMVALVYLAVHANAAVAARLIRACRSKE